MTIALLSTLAESLTDVAVKGTMLLLLAVLTVLAMRKTSAAARHLVWTLSFLALLALPFMSLIAPRWGVPIPAFPAAHAVTSVEQPDMSPAATIVAPIREATASPTPSAALAVREVTRVDPPPPGLQSGARLQGPELSWWQWLIIGWMAGVIVIAATVLGSLLKTAQLRRSCVEVSRGRVLRKAQTLAGALRIRRPVTVLECRAASMPLTWGTFSPVVLLPAEADTWSDELLRAVLLHELAHVTRFDCFTQVLSRFACALYWFHPLAWYGARRLRVEREVACDDVVLAAGSRPSEYAGYLLDMARRLKTGALASVASIALARPSQLSGRLLAVLDATRSRAGLSPRLAVPAWIATLAVVVPLAGARPAVQEAPVSAPIDLESLTAAAADESSASHSQTAGLAWTRALRQRDAVAAAIGNTESVNQECDWYATRSSSSSISVSNDEMRIRIRTGECHLEVDAVGRITFNEDETDIASITAGGHFEIEERQGRETRRLEVTPTDGGELQRRWVVNGRVRWTVTGEIAGQDPEAEAWLARILPVMFRRSGYQARERAERIHAQRGLEGVLQEVELIPSDHAARMYLAVLLTRRDLRPEDVVRVVRLAGASIGSDFELAELLVSMARAHPMDEMVRLAYVEAADSIGSDFEQRRVLAAVLEREGLSQDVAAAMLESAVGIGSDFEIAELLLGVLRRRPIDRALTAPFFRAVATIGSDFERRRVLHAALEQGAPDLEILDRTLESAVEIDSDFELAQLLIEVASLYPLDRTLPGSYVAAAQTLSSDYEAGRVWLALLERETLAPAALEALLDASSSISSDWQLAELLVRVAQSHRFSEGTSGVFFRAASEIGSDHELARVLTTVIERDGLDNTIAGGILASAKTIASDFELANVLVRLANAHPIDQRLRPVYLEAASTIGSRYERDRALAALVAQTN